MSNNKEYEKICIKMENEGKFKLYIDFCMNMGWKALFNDEKSYSFKYNDYNFILDYIGMYDEHPWIDSKYSMCIGNFINKEDAELMFKKVKIALIMISLYMPQNIFVVIDRHDIFPSNAWIASSNCQLPGVDISLNNNLLKYLKEVNSLNINKLFNDEKLILALEIYAELSLYSNKTQFLNLVTILEILKPNYEISEKSDSYLRKIKKYIKKLKESEKKSEGESEEYHELERFLSSMSHWNEKSISKSLQLYCKNNERSGKYDNVETEIKAIYNIRSTLVHSGKIKDKNVFEDKFSFLKDVVKDILLDKIDRYV